MLALSKAVENLFTAGRRTFLANTGSKEMTALQT
jgi:hypothetical protein